MHLRLLRPANDVARLDAMTAARGVEERARALLVAVVVGPEGPREVWCSGEPAPALALRDAG